MKLTLSSHGGKSTSAISGGPYNEPNKLYTMTMCLSEGDYVFTMYDDGKNGLCCSQGNGSYSLTLGNSIIDTSAILEAVKRKY